MCVVDPSNAVVAAPKPFHTVTFHCSDAAFAASVVSTVTCVASVNAVIW